MGALRFLCAFWAARDVINPFMSTTAIILFIAQTKTMTVVDIDYNVLQLLAMVGHYSTPPPPAQSPMDTQ